MKNAIQISQFEGYDEEFGGFIVHVLIGGNEHEIAYQCYPYQDGYAEELVDVYGSGADCLYWVDGEELKLSESFIADCDGDEFAEKVFRAVIDEIIDADWIHEEEMTEKSGSGKDKEYEQKAARGWFVNVEEEE